MNKELAVQINLFAILIIAMTLLQFDVYGQTQNETERTINVMRAKQFYGSGAKMDLMINGELFYKLKTPDY